MKQVLIATPSYDGRLDVWYVNSLIETVKLGLTQDIYFQPIFMSYDALVQRARNDLMKVAVEGEFDAVLWIDSDMEWDPNYAIELVQSEHAVCGGTCRKKTDDQELYVTTFFSGSLQFDTGRGIYVKALGTGFMKMSKEAIIAAWDVSPPYRNPGGKDSRMVFDLAIIDGELYSEDSVLFNKLSSQGFDAVLYPHMNCNHVGTKKFVGNFEEYIKRMV